VTFSSRGIFSTSDCFGSSSLLSLRTILSMPLSFSFGSTASCVREPGLVMNNVQCLENNCVCVRSRVWRLVSERVQHCVCVFVWCSVFGLSFVAYGVRFRCGVLFGVHAFQTPVLINFPPRALALGLILNAGSCCVHVRVRIWAVLVLEFMFT
jgi:hypothetical protein